MRRGNGHFRTGDALTADRAVLGLGPGGRAGRLRIHGIVCRRSMIDCRNGDLRAGQDRAARRAVNTFYAGGRAGRRAVDRIIGRPDVDRVSLRIAGPFRQRVPGFKNVVQPVLLFGDGGLVHGRKIGGGPAERMILDDGVPPLGLERVVGVHQVVDRFVPPAGDPGVDQVEHPARPVGVRKRAVFHVPVEVFVLDPARGLGRVLQIRRKDGRLIGVGVDVDRAGVGDVVDQGPVPLLGTDFRHRNDRYGVAHHLESIVVQGAQHSRTREQQHVLRELDVVVRQPRVFDRGAVRAAVRHQRAVPPEHARNGVEDPAQRR